MNKVLFYALAILLLNSCNAQKTDLSLKLKKGSAYSQVTVSKATVSQTVNGQQMNMKMNITGNVSYLVKEIGDTYYDMEVKYNSVSMEMVLPQGSANFSSEKKDEKDIVSTLLGGMTGKPFYIRMTKKGKIEEIKGIDSLYESLISKFPQIPEDQKSGIKAQLMKAFGDKALKGNIEMITAMFPDNLVSKGDKWIINTEMETVASGKTVSTYEYMGESNGFNLIHGSSKIATADKDAYIETSGMPMKYNLTGTMISDIKIDKETGWIVEAKINQDIHGDTQIKDNPKVPGGMTIPMAIKNETMVTNK